MVLVIVRDENVPKSLRRTVQHDQCKTCGSFGRVTQRHLSVYVHLLKELPIEQSRQIIVNRQLVAVPQDGCDTVQVGG